MEPFTFSSREAFRTWLAEHAHTSEGIYIRFIKGKQTQTLTANQALEEALCFGWIDGHMKKVDDTSHVEYFALRKKQSKWSLKNKQLVEALLAKGLVTELGIQKIEEAKENGLWQAASKPSDISEKEIKELENQLQVEPEAYKNFKAMSASIRKTYTRAYLDAKTEQDRNKRLQWIIDRVKQNLKPM
ncbi:hypothetical protein A4S06_03285 [Erysipelotrichaceae bacterium MTC7]|nr:hypothetical protein A4S06_03285 [Erysipelotrichaceae bacterium MTC7]